MSHGNATLPFVVSRPNDDSGEANAVVLLLPGIGHFYVENMHPLPLQGASEHLWSNLAFKETVTACAWPVAGQAGSPPAWMLPDGADWTKAVYTMEVLPLLLAVQRDASPRISSPTSVGLGLDELILGIEPSTLTGQGNSCLALSAKFRLGDSPASCGAGGVPACLGLPDGSDWNEAVQPALAGGRALVSQQNVALVLGEAPLADHHGVLWAGPPPLFSPLSPHWLTTMGQLHTSEHTG